MAKFIYKSLIGVIITLFLVSIFVFFFVRLLPGTPARILLGDDATPEAIEIITKQYGLDKPIYSQYAIWIKGVVQGDLGNSLRTKMPVINEISGRYWNTMKLALISVLWSVIAGVLIGIWSGTHVSKWQDYVGVTAAVAGQAIPKFWIGLMLILVFSVKLKWLPVVSTNSFKGMILPAFTLGASLAATVTRFTRSSIIEALKEDYTRTARAKGLRERTVIYKHVLRNSMIPVITIVGLQFGVMLGGSILVESVFSYNGLGTLLIDSISYRDYPTIQALVLIFSLHFVIINFLVDILYAVLNPEIRLS